ncbi:MAG: phosphoribosyltransferase family protein [bacterium]|nr:phosphoribosyltransferase family protein [bacterium]
MKLPSAILNSFFPLFCINCEKIISEGWICESCYQSVRKDINFTDPHPSIQLLIVKFHYEGAIRRAIEIWKYYPSPKFGKLFLKSEIQKDWIDASLKGESYDCIVPIPPHRSHVRERGFDPIEQLSKFISNLTQIPIQKALKRTGIQKPQTQLNDYQRYQNVIGIFQSKQVVKKKIIVVDDVMTTGSTILEASETLIKNGAEKIAVMAVAAALSKLRWFKNG